MRIETVADYACGVGEGSLWHPLEKRLYWVDIPKGRVFCYEPANGQSTQVYEGETVGGLTVQADGALLLFMARGAVRSWRDGRLSTLIDHIPEEKETRFNDVIADPVGRVFCGTMPTKDRLGRLYRLDPDLSFTKLLEGIGCANGMGFTPDGKQMYFTDSRVRTVYLFDYDSRSGAISNQRILVRQPESASVPDGLTVDRFGYIWSAQWGGSCVIRYSPAGEEERRIPLPAIKITSLTFGGPDYTDMYLTSAGGEGRPKEDPLAGAVFKLNVGIPGVPEFFSRIQL